MRFSPRRLIARGRAIGGSGRGRGGCRGEPAPGVWGLQRERFHFRPAPNRLQRLPVEPQRVSWISRSERSESRSRKAACPF